MPLNFGGFAGGLAGGLELGQRMKLQADEHKLKAKMLENQLKQQEQAQQEQQQRTLELGKYVDMLSKGVPQTVTPGYESPEQSMSVAPVESNYRPANPQELLGQGLKTVPEAHRYNLLQQSMKPQAGQRPMSVGVGGTVFDPTTGQEIYRNPTPRTGVGVDSKTWADIENEHPGADLATKRKYYNEAVANTSAARAGSAKEAQINAASTPSALAKQTDIAAAKTAGGPLPAGVEDVLAKGETLFKTLGDVRANYDPNYLGPVKGTDLAFETRRRVGSAVGMPTGDREVKFRQALSDAKNQIIYLMSGKQINESEGRRLIAQMPAATDEPSVFLAGLDRFESQVKRTLQAHQQAGTATRSDIRPGGKQPITAAIAQQFLQQAGGDPTKARQAAIAAGYDPSNVVK